MTENQAIELARAAATRTADWPYHEYQPTPEQARAWMPHEWVVRAIMAATVPSEELADSEGTRAVQYLRRARKAEQALRALADAADAVGVRHFDSDWLTDEVQAMRDATLHARDVLDTPKAWAQAVRETITDPVMAERILSIPSDATPEEAASLLRPNARLSG